ncbi:MAG: M20 family metallopeptidase [Eubacteriales bacterium]|nr:M20 family metallopeptidase [Eubacteriales bacterium]
MSVNAKKIFDEALELEQEIIADRRVIHKNPEVGSELPKTKEYVKKKLAQTGCEDTQICGSGIVSTITGKEPGRCILLRADMDALNIRENTELDFRSGNGNMHACGHDMHTAMLLGAARLLKKHQNEIKGTVKLVFQPDEEGFTGAKEMLKAGVLTSPVPQAGFSLHVNSGMPSGIVLCGRGTFMAGCTLFRISINGAGCHGAMPEKGIDPINIAAHVYLSLQEITSREISAKIPAVVTIGKFMSGKAPNIIPQKAVLEGTIRTFDRELSKKILKRIETIACSTAKAFRGSAVVEEISSAPPLINNPELVNQMGDYVEEMFGAGVVYRLDEGGMGSEDFASYTYEIPCAYLLLGAGTKQENPLFGKPMHNEKVVFNEDILAKGAAIHAYCAMKWLESNL